MPMVCDHHVRETRRGTGECQIESEIKQRNGKPLWWCRTHGLKASAPDGNPLPACPGKWLEAVPDSMRTEIDLAHGEVAVWGVLPPTLTFGERALEAGGVHVHQRTRPDEGKAMDQSFDVVDLVHGEARVTIEGMAAVANSISQLAGVQVVPLQCPQCGGFHIDELKFAATAHRKHQCNDCGRPFYDKAPSVGNPLADIYKRLGLPAAPAPDVVDRPLELRSAEYEAIHCWPSNQAIISTMSRPEEVGVHVHAWDLAGNMAVDETYSPVTIDGRLVDEAALRALAVQRASHPDAIVWAQNCPKCGAAVLSPATGWMDPSTHHTCGSCSTPIKTRRRVFLNPLGDLLP